MTTGLRDAAPFGMATTASANPGTDKFVKRGSCGNGASPASSPNEASVPSRARAPASAVFMTVVGGPIGFGRERQPHVPRTPKATANRSAPVTLALAEPWVEGGDFRRARARPRRRARRTLRTPQRADAG